MVEQSRKIRSVTFDTSAFSDVALYISLAQNPALITEQNIQSFERAKRTFLVFEAIIEASVERVWNPVCEKELAANSPEYKEAYLSIVSRHPHELRKREAKHLAQEYIECTGIPDDDALLLAFAVLDKVDLLLTWDERHFLKDGKRAKLEAVDKSHGHKTPMVMAPDGFVEHIRFEAGGQLCYYINGVLPKYRLNAYLSKLSP